MLVATDEIKWAVDVEHPLQVHSPLRSVLGVAAVQVGAFLEVALAENLPAAGSHSQIELRPGATSARGVWAAW